MIGFSPIFVGGAPRSGTTLLRVILDTHPNIACGTEMRVIQGIAAFWSGAWQSSAAALTQGYGMEDAAFRATFRSLIASFLEPHWKKSGKPRIAEKTPSNVLAFRELHTLFPESPLIHIIRDGRDVVASRIERDLKTTPSTDPVALAGLRAREWADTMALAARYRSELKPRYFELRYEALVQTPEPVLRELFAFLGEPFDARVLDFHNIERNVDGTEEWSAEGVKKPIFQNSIGRYRDALTTPMLAAVHGNAGAMLNTLGYGGAL